MTATKISMKPGRGFAALVTMNTEAADGRLFKLYRKILQKLYPD